MQKSADSQSRPHSLLHMGPVGIQNVMQDVHMIQHGTCALGHAVQRVLSHMHVDAGLALDQLVQPLPQPKFPLKN